MKYKTWFIVVGIVLISAVAVAASLLQSTEWSCYETSEGYCECTKSSSGGDAQCNGQSGYVTYATTALDSTVATPSRCRADVLCEDGQISLCLGTSSCLAEPDMAFCDNVMFFC